MRQARSIVVVLLCAVAVSVSLSGHAKANLINVTTITDTPMLWEGFLIHSAPFPPPGAVNSISVVFPGTNWSVTVEEGDLFNSIQDRLRGSFSHLVAPHAGEIAPNGPFEFFQGPSFVPGGAALGGAFFSPFLHPNGPDMDVAQFLYTPIVGTAQSQLSIRLFHGANVLDAPPLTAPLSAVPEPATLALFGLGLAGLGFMRRRRTA